MLAAIRTPNKTDFDLPVARDSPNRDPFDFADFFPDGLSPAVLQTSHLAAPPSLFFEHPTSSCQKLLFSATLTRDPGKISTLELHDPKYFVVQGSDATVVSGSTEESSGAVMDVVMEKFSMPATLSVIRSCLFKMLVDISFCRSIWL